MKIAVIGAGYAGCALTWHLLQKEAEVTLFDGGEGASHASTGLMHLRVGKKREISLRAVEGRAASLELLELASSRRTVFVQNGMLRIEEGERIWDPDAVAVFSRLYLEELKQMCSKATIVEQWVSDLSLLAGFDAIVFTTGWMIDLPLKRTIGQCLLCKVNEPIGFSYLGKAHITPTEDPLICQVGSTYEHTEVPDREKALRLLDQCVPFYPQAQSFEVLEIRSGVRAAPLTGYMPIVKKVAENRWVFGGLGSRGLLYHALFAKSLAEEICSK